jgi:hypothetical protein
VAPTGLLYGSQLLGNPEGGETGHNKAYDFTYLLTDINPDVTENHKTSRVRIIDSHATSVAEPEPPEPYHFDPRRTETVSLL